MESLGRVGARDGAWGPGLTIGSESDLMEVERMTECDWWGELDRKWRNQIG